MVLKVLPNRGDDPLNVGFAFGARLPQCFPELFVGFRMEVLEGEIFQLPFQLCQTQPVGKWGVDGERLARNRLAPLRRKRCKGAHVVQPVGKLDQDDAHIADEREQELAVGLGFGDLAVLDDAGDLGHAVHDFGDGGAEFGLDVSKSERGVFDDVVQQSSSNGDVVQGNVSSNDPGDLHRMCPVGFARGAEAILVRLHAEVKGFA